MAPLIERVIAPLTGGPALPLLAFAMTASERKLLSRAFPDFVSASLFGSYGDDHHEGVDARDLSRYRSGSMAGLFASCVFDYFPEHGAALDEAFRVVADGGLLFTHIAPHRLTDDMAPPATVGTLERATGYRSYLPAAGLPSISVGRHWFVDALVHAGFDGRSVSFGGQADDPTIEWFVGIKPGSGSQDAGDGRRGRGWT